MSLAEEMLASISVDDGIQTYSAEEEHIVVNDMRQIIVPNSLKTIAVEGDKDIETVTFDCVRYWDGNDLSTFAIYLNYVLPDKSTGTYIPEAINTSEGDNFYHFDWKIKNTITQKSGKISFAITAIKTKQNDEGETVVDKQWSSLPNADCTIAVGLDISNVPDDEESAGVLAQMSAILEQIHADVDEWIKNALVQTTGSSETKAMSQKATTNAIESARVESVSYTDEKTVPLYQSNSKNQQLISKNSKRISNLERGIPPERFYTDKSVSYVKDVPSNSLPYSDVKRIGGMSYISKNLFIPSKVNQTSLGITFSYYNGYVKLNGTKGSGANVISVQAPNITLQAGTYIVSCRMVGGSITNTPENFLGVYFGINKSTYGQRTTPAVAKVGDVGTRVITFSEPTTITSFDITPDYDSSGFVFNNALFEFQFKVGDTVTAYQDGFEGLRDSKVTEIKSIGANVLNIEGNEFGSDKWFRTMNNGLTISSFSAGKYTFTSKDNYLNITAYDSSGYHWLSRFVELEPNTNYRLSISGISCIIVGLNDKAINTIGTQLTVTNKVFNSGNYKYWMISFYGTGAGAVMISKGDEEIEFSPYKESKIKIPSSVLILDGYGQGNPNNDAEFNSIIWEDEARVVYSHVGNIVNGSWVSLASEEIVDISDLVTSDNLIEVEPFGTLVFENEHAFAVPSEVEYQLEV